MTVTAVDPKNNCITVIRKIKQDEVQEKMAVAVPVNLNISELEQLTQDGLYLVIFPENLTAQEQQNLIEQQKKSNMITALAVGSGGGVASLLGGIAGAPAGPPGIMIGAAVRAVMGSFVTAVTRLFT